MAQRTDELRIGEHLTGQYRGWRRLIPRDALAGASLALIINTGVTGLLGFGYWILAARIFPAESVGSAGAVVAAAALLSGLGQLNLSGMVMRFLPTASHHSRSLILLAYGIAGGAALLISLAAIAGASALGLTRALPGVGSADAWLLLALSPSTAWFTLQDSLLLALNRPALVPMINAGYGVAKLALLPVFAAYTTTAESLLLSWTVPLVIVAPAVAAIAFWRLAPASAEKRAPVSAATRSAVRRFVLGDAGAGLFGQAWSYSLPLVVTATLGTSANAKFYAAYLLATTVDLLAANLASALTVHGAAASQLRRTLVTTTLSRTVRLTSAAALVGIVSAPFALSFFGPGYADAGSALQLLLLASLPRCVLAVYYAVCRMSRQTHRSAALQFVVCVGVLGTAPRFADEHGLVGVAACVVAWQLVACLFAWRGIAAAIGGQHRRRTGAPSWSAVASPGTRPQGSHRPKHRAFDRQLAYQGTP